MKVTCAQCGGVSTLKSRPNEEFTQGGVYWRNYAVCSECGATSSYETTGRVVFVPPDWIPHKANPRQTHQKTLELAQEIN